MNRDQFEGYWHELKGKVRQHWGQLNDDEVNKIGGKVEELSGTLQRKYGYTKEKAESEIDSFLKSLEKDK